MKARALLFFAVIVLAGDTACSTSSLGSAKSQTSAALEAADQSPPFAADPSARMSPADWDALFRRVVALPGASTDADGPLLVSVSVGPPSTPAYYLFTTAKHPAHPAFIRAVPTNDDATRTEVEAGFAGSQEEYETFVRAFLAHMATSQ